MERQNQIADVLSRSEIGEQGLLTNSYHDSKANSHRDNKADKHTSPTSSPLLDDPKSQVEAISARRTNNPTEKNFILRAGQVMPWPQQTYNSGKYMVQTLAPPRNGAKSYNNFKAKRAKMLSANNGYHDNERRNKLLSQAETSS
jgi:hypothetical protein